MITREQQVAALEKRLKTLKKALGENLGPIIVTQITYCECKVHEAIEKLRLGIEATSAAKEPVSQETIQRIVAACKET